MTDKLKAIQTWKQMRDTHESLKRTVLELLRHPDATAKDLAEVRRIYIVSHNCMVNAQEKLLDKFGKYGGIVKFQQFTGEGK